MVGQSEHNHSVARETDRVKFHKMSVSEVVPHFICQILIEGPISLCDGLIGISL